MPIMDHLVYVKKAGCRSNIQRRMSRHVASSHTYKHARSKNGTRSKLPSWDAVFLIGSLPRPSWTRMRCPATTAKNQAGRWRHALLLLGREIKVRARPVSSALLPATREGVQHTVCVCMALYAGGRLNTRINGARDRRAGARIQNGVSRGLTPCTRACSGSHHGGRAWWGRERVLMAHVSQEGKTCCWLATRMFIVIATLVRGLGGSEMTQYTALFMQTL
jgi:hypothetical protein